MPDVDVSVVTWNSAPVLRALLESIEAQTVVPKSITVVDNASTDGTLEVCKAFPRVTVLQQTTNTGFAHAHNLGIAQGHAAYVLVINPDVVLAPNYLEEALHVLEAFPQAGACVGVVRRPDGRVDTCGLRVTRSRVVQERVEPPVMPQRISGVSGAVALYRRAALHDVAVGGQFFDERLFAYKEDVQLAWRLQWAGWQAYCVPTALATHGRVVGKETQRSARSHDRRFYSYRNHLLLYATVETPGTLLPDAFFLCVAELARLGFLLCTDFRVTMRALAAAGKMWHAARTFAAQQRRTVDARSVRSEMLA